MHKYRSYGPDKLADQFDIYLTPVTLTLNLPEKMFQMALLLKGNNFAKLFLNPCIIVRYGPDKSGRTHAHSPN